MLQLQRRSEQPISFEMQRVIQAFKQPFERFLDEGNHVRNKWIEVDVDHKTIVNVYLRKQSFRTISQEEFVTSLDIPNITVNEPGKGYGMAVIDYVHHHNPYDITWIENVHNEQFYRHLIRTYWLPHYRDRACVYRLTKVGTAKFPNIGLISAR